jgi:hypothetical protein
VLSKKVRSLEKYLLSLQAGARSWFWFCPDCSDLPLLMEGFSNPNGMARLLERASSLTLPMGAHVTTGIAAVDGNGVLQFGGPMVGAELLAQLSAWVRSHVAEHPGLARLRGAQAIHVDSSGAVQGRFVDEALWEGIPKVMIPGSLGAAAQTLQDLSAGEDAWIWLSEGSSEPVVVALPVASDPRAEALGPLVVSGRLRSGVRGAGLRGTARRLGSGALLVSTVDDLDALGERLSAWLAALGEVRLVQLAEGQPIAGRRIGGVAVGEDLSAQITALQAIKDGATFVFWFTERASSGAPLLLLEESSSALKTLATKAATDAPAVRGQVTAARWGIELRTSKPSPELLPALARWVGQHIDRWPGLDALVGARMTVRSRDGEIVQRLKDDEAWAPLRSKGAM